jgi:hypothetical protein
VRFAGYLPQAFRALLRSRVADGIHDLLLQLILQSFGRGRVSRREVLRIKG